MTSEAHNWPRSPEREAPRPGGHAETEAVQAQAPGPPEGRFERFGMPTAVLDVHEAAAYLAVTEGTVYRLARGGTLPHVRIGRSVRFRVSDLDAFLERQTTRTWRPHGRTRGQTKRSE